MSFWGVQNCPKCDQLLCFFFGLRNPVVRGFSTEKPKKVRVLSSKRIGPHNIDILSVIFGTMLGDAHAEKRANATRISFSQESSNMEHLIGL